jgi:hypothetical protein
MVDETIKEIVIEYVKEQHLSKIKKSEVRIYDFCSLQVPKTMTVYRGHENRQPIRPNMWYSSTTDINIATNEFANGKNGCVYIIHLTNIPCIHINDWIGDKIGDKKDENEIIFLGGGKFYKNNEFTEEGYIELGEQNKWNKLVFECWYTFDTKRIVERVLSIIDPTEYEFISSIDDIICNNLPLSIKDKKEIFNEIQKRKLIIN